MAIVMEEPATRPVSVETDAPTTINVERFVPWLVALAALAIGASLFASYWQQSRQIWYMIDHDRSAHLEFSVNLAMDLRHGNLRGLLHHLDGARVWGPLHGVISAPVQLLFGPDHRIGVVPSWCAWIASIVLGFLIGRRLLPEGGTIAGVLAAMLIALSPAHRAYATDVMLESLGTALTLTCLLRYLIAVQDADDKTAGRWLGVSLTALFLTKANYWVIVALGLCVGEFVRQPRLILGWAAAFARYVTSKDCLVRQLRNPFNYLIVGLAAVAIWIAVTGGGVFEIGKTKIRLTHSHNVAMFAYGIAFVRAIVWWRREGIGAKLADAAPMCGTIAAWHLWPVAAYLALPKRLGYFLWYLSPANTDQNLRGGVFGRGLVHYYQALIEDYHVFAWLLPVIAIGALIGLATLRQWRKGSVTLFCFLALAFLATVQHPMHKYRFAHSWAPVLWILGSAGAIHVSFLALRAFPKLRLGVAAAACLAIAVVHGPYWLQTGHAQEGGVRPEALSILKITEPFLPAVRENRPMILSTVYTPFYLAWSYQEAARHQRFETVIDGLDLKQPDPASLKAWADKTPCDCVVLIEFETSSPFFVDDVGNLNTTAVRRFLEGDSGFGLRERWTLPERVEITVWRKSSTASRER